MSHCDAIIVDSGPGGALAAEGDYFPGVAGTGSSNAKGAKADELLVEMSTSTTWNHRMTRSPIVLAKARLQLAVWALAISACSGGTEPEPPAAVSTVTVSPSTLQLVSGSTGTLTAVLRDAAGNILSGRAVTWASSAEQVATVSQQGVVIAFASGPATISATSEGRAGSAT